MARGRPPRVAEGERPLLARRLTELRRDKGVSQKELATAVGLSQSAIADYETGKVTPPLKALAVLSGYFGIILSDIVAEEEREILDQRMANAGPEERKLFADPQNVLDRVEFAKQVGKTVKELVEIYRKVTSVQEFSAEQIDHILNEAIEWSICILFMGPDKPFEERLGLALKLHEHNLLLKIASNGHLPAPFGVDGHQQS
jgi:transcriptional regulator with XRE-family HTH domain